MNTGNHGELVAMFSCPWKRLWVCWIAGSDPREDKGCPGALYAVGSTRIANVQFVSPKRSQFFYFILLSRKLGWFFCGVPLFGTKGRRGPSCHHPHVLHEHHERHATWEERAGMLWLPKAGMSSWDFRKYTLCQTLTINYGKTPCYKWENSRFLWAFSIANC